MALSLAGKRAIVFGGSSGIGLAVANQLHVKGASVVIVSRDPEKSIAKAIENGAPPLPSSIKLAKCNVLDKHSVQALFESQGKLDILISSATGGARAVGPFLEMDLDGFKGSYDKFWGYVTVVRYGTHHLTPNGNIVLVSGAPARRAKPGQIALSCVGASVEQFARALAPEIAPRRINVVSPGLIDTPMFGQKGEDRESFFTKGTEGNLIPRCGTPDEVAGAILFAVENGFVTGTTIDVDGGWLTKL